MCHFHMKLGHYQKDCLKFKLLLKKKLKPHAFVCFESNLIEIPSNTRWINFGANTHVRNLVQGFNIIEITNSNKYFVHIEKCVKAFSEWIDTYNLVLDSEFCLDLLGTIYVPSGFLNLI